MVRTDHVIRPFMRRAIRTQAERLEFVSSFQMGHPAAFELTGRTAEIPPLGLDQFKSLFNRARASPLKAPNIDGSTETE